MGKLIVERLEFEKVEQLFMEKDFFDRTVLKIITDNNITSFIVKAKLKFLLESIWSGKNFFMIDGKIQHFSKTNCLLNNEIRNI